MENSLTRRENHNGIKSPEFRAMSFGQKRLWLIDQLNPGLTAYHLFSIYPVDGHPINRKSLNLAFKLLSERHEILRTTFPMVDGEPVQKINGIEEKTFDFRYFDLSNKKFPIKMADKIAYSQLKTPFNLATGPLLRAQLVKVDNEKFLIVVFLHHIITDGWSMEILKRELLYIYSCIEENEKIDLPPLKHQYKDFTAWHSNQVQGRRAKNHRDYWMQDLHGKLTRVELPFIKTRSPKQTFKGDSTLTYIDAETTKMLKKLNMAYGVSYFTVLLAILKITLSKHSGESDIIIGTNTSNLRLYGFENNIGLFLDTIVLRSFVNKNEAFSSFIKQVNLKLIKAFQHQIYPLNQIIQDIRYHRDYSRNPVFDILVTMQNHGERNVSLPNNTFNTPNPDNFFKVKLKKECSIVDLEFGFRERNGGTVMGINFNSNLYAKKDIEQFAQHVLGTANIVARNPQVFIKDIGMLNEAGILRLKNFRSLANIKKKNRNPIEHFRENVDTKPDAIAVMCNDVMLTYREVDKMSDAVSNYLINVLQLEISDRIGVIMTRSSEWLICLLAILKSEMIYVPLDPLLPAKRINYIAENCPLKILISDKEYKSLAGDLACLNSAELIEKAKSFKQHYSAKVPSPNSIAYMMYTSGSTGNPKGVMISHKALSNYIQTFNDYFKLDANDSVLQQASIGFDTSLEEVLPALCVGGKICIFLSGQYWGGSLNHCLENEKINIISTTPYIINKLNNTPLTSLKSLRLIISGGDKLRTHDIDNLIESIAIFNTYGPVETTICVTFQAVKSLSHISIIGKPINGANICILDEYGGLVPQGQIGEICIGGAGLCVGYDCHAESGYENSFIKDPFESTSVLFKSGDLGRWDDTGKIEFIGRNDTQVKINGARVEINEVERAILEYQLKLEVYVTTSQCDNNHLENFLIAYLIAPDLIESDKLRQFLSEKLPLYMIPRYFVQLESWPVSLNGKILIDKLPIPSQRDLRSFDQTASTPMQRAILDIWRTAFENNSIGIHDNFFELGGHSILALEITHKIQKFCKVFITFPDLFRFPTIVKLASLIEEKIVILSEEETSLNI